MIPTRFIHTRSRRKDDSHHPTAVPRADREDQQTNHPIVIAWRQSPKIRRRNHAHYPCKPVCKTGSPFRHSLALRVGWALDLWFGLWCTEPTVPVITIVLRLRRMSRARIRRKQLIQRHSAKKPAYGIGPTKRKTHQTTGYGPGATAIVTVERRVLVKRLPEARHVCRQTWIGI